MAPAPPGPSQHRNGKATSTRATGDGTAFLKPGIEASAGWAEAREAVAGGSKVHPDDVGPQNRKARRAAAAKARKGRA